MATVEVSLTEEELLELSQFGGHRPMKSEESPD